MLDLGKWAANKYFDRIVEGKKKKVRRRLKLLRLKTQCGMSCEKMNAQVWSRYEWGQQLYLVATSGRTPNV